MTPTTVTEITHSVISRYFPTLQHIHAVASFVHLYTLHGSPNGGSHWNREPIQGSLFLLESLNGPRETTPITSAATGAPIPHFYLLLLNRKDMTTFWYRLKSKNHLDFGEEGCHIMMSPDGAATENRAEGDELAGYGIYIHDKEEETMEQRRIMCPLVEKLAGRADEIAEEEERAMAQNAGGGRGGNQGGVDLMAALNGGGAGGQSQGPGVLDALFKNARVKWEQQNHQQQPVQQQPQQVMGYMPQALQMQGMRQMPPTMPNQQPQPYLWQGGAVERSGGC